MNEQAIFLAALEILDAAERQAYVLKTCAGDRALRRQVESLLAAHARSGEFLDVPACEQIGAGASLPLGGTVALQRSAPREKKSAEPEYGSGLSDTQAEPRSDEKDERILDFLQPSTKPGALGRLGHYEVLELVGQGGFGTVVRAFDEKLHRMVAIKIMSPQLATTSPARKRFIREARSSAAIRHENVVDIHAIEEQPIPFLVMEYVAGETLQQRLDGTGPLDATEVLRIGVQIAYGLAAAHAMGKIHRDIKPANILLENGVDRVKITDFGLARAADDASLTQSGFIAGTPMYMAPEQAQGVAIDHRADLFSFGSVLYVMCSGRAPFRASTTLAVLKRVAEDTPRPIREILPEVPEWLCAVISRLHAKRPEERFQTAKDVADLLGKYLAELQLHGKVQSGVRLVAQPTAAPATEPTPSSPPTREHIPMLAGNGPAPRLLARRLAIAAAALLSTMLLGLSLTEATGVTQFSGTVIRLLSPDGTLIVEVDDPDVSVSIDGGEVVIKGAGTKEIRVKPGQYKVLATRDGTVVSQELVSVIKGGKQVVRISREAAQGDPDRKAAEYVLSIGGTVQVNDQDRKLDTVDELPREPFRLTWVGLKHNHQLSEAGLVNFKECRNLTFLGMFDTSVSNAGLANFQNCKNLTFLNLSRTKAGDTGLANFKDCKDLSIAVLSETRVSDAGLSYLKDCKNLLKLFLQNTRVTAAGIDDLKRALPRCRIEWDGGVIERTVSLEPDRRAAEYVLSMGGVVQVNGVSRSLRDVAELPPDPLRLTYVNFIRNGQVNDAGLAHFKGCKHLIVAHLEFTNVSDAGLANLKDCTKLLSLNLSGESVSDTGLAHFKECKDLTQLTLHGTRGSDTGLAHFKDCKKLQILALNNMPLTDAGLAQFKDCKNLKHVDLARTRVSDAGLAQFKDCKNLVHIVVRSTQITGAGIDDLKMALPQCKIEWDGGVVEPAAP